MLDNSLELYSVPVTMDRHHISSTLIVNTSMLSSPVIVFTCRANNSVGNSEAHFSYSTFSKLVLEQFINRIVILNYCGGNF